jgi:hypothetical protein
MDEVGGEPANELLQGSDAVLPRLAPVGAEIQRNEAGEFVHDEDPDEGETAEEDAVAFGVDVNESAGSNGADRSLLGSSLKGAGFGSLEGGVGVAESLPEAREAAFAQDGGDLLLGAAQRAGDRGDREMGLDPDEGEDGVGQLTVDRPSSPVARRGGMLVCVRPEEVRYSEKATRLPVAESAAVFDAFRFVHVLAPDKRRGRNGKRCSEHPNPSRPG